MTRLEDMRKKGKIRSWNEQKAFGFIQPSGGGKDVFLHISGLSNRNRVPAVGQHLTFTLSTDKQGRTCAVEALLPGDRFLVQKDKDKSKVTVKVTVKGAILVAGVFFGCITAFVYAEKLPVFFLWWYLAASLVTFFAYAFDKSAAKSGAWRTPEATLHWLSLAGGWPGALVAQQALRHKSKKKTFRTAFWVTVIANCGALVWLCTPGGAQLLQDLVWATQ